MKQIFTSSHSVIFISFQKFLLLSLLIFQIVPPAHGAIAFILESTKEDNMSSLSQKKWGHHTCLDLVHSLIKELQGIYTEDQIILSAHESISTPLYHTELEKIRISCIDTSGKEVNAPGLSIEHLQLGLLSTGEFLKIRYSKKAQEFEPLDILALQKWYRERALSAGKDPTTQTTLFQEDWLKGLPIGDHSKEKIESHHWWLWGLLSTLSLSAAGYGIYRYKKIHRN